MYEPIQSTPPLKEQRDFVWAYELVYRKLKKLCEGKPELLKDLEESYQTGKEALNL